ncbi:hypothetical protein LTR10_019099 [Elasticomyces elasticus]|uniref:UNC-45/Cro1/She4 central domain-containing protein n=1 Tax=Exophiala sideris TaxID=1016849 RepID=A0ABR0JHQ3_9EURO|nr:hypothetical protein LTR10_019099 [Elasticomyces elasticus]KAK5033493.1 hypothetical protein LTS07_003797 [Exophiala sideris]KAK5042012.1 hypothetical protein LTR13_001818 [Exophiala sideris]KAK5064037.1 hypothetical protein LTR69_003805 [Exophiala sideris]KAK5185280.1 hypothetical protein LTR44_002269 [Eurotiomycetes sp. CCFEE 6388]
MATVNEREACLRLAEALSEQPLSNRWLLQLCSTAVSKLQNADLNETKQVDIPDALKSLTTYFHHATTNGSKGYNPQLSVLLADITRERPFWRPLFGLLERPSPEANLRQLSGKDRPDCILEVARRIISREWGLMRRDEDQGALRLIANCCADNNINRHIIVQRGGVESLMARVATGGLIFPTLYNVCIDYDEPAIDSEGKPLAPLSKMQASTVQPLPTQTLNLAEQKLGRYFDPLAQKRACSVTLLVNASPHAGPHLSVLADLIEMASRIALYGSENLLTSASGETQPQQTQNQGLDPRSLVHPLIFEGSVISKDEPDSCASICQAVLNILSQQDFRDPVSHNDKLLWHLIHLPYVWQAGREEDEDEELIESLAPYRKAILKTVYEISASNFYFAISGPGSKIVGRCTDYLHEYQRGSTSSTRDPDHVYPGPLASVCVLVANSLTRTEHVVGFLATGTPIASYLTTILECSLDPDVLLPAVNIATRLCLCREGQDVLHTASLMNVAQKLLKPTSETDTLAMDIQRETVTLVRLLIKGRPAFLSDLNIEAMDDSGENKTVMASVLTLFEKTNDPRTKIEIGRLAIEMLRTHFSKDQHIAQSDAEPGRSIDEHDFLTMCNVATPNNTLTIADTIAYIITQPQAQSQPPGPSSTPVPGADQVQAEAEAWFGLGLLSTLPSSRPWIMSALSRNENQLLIRLRQIVQDKSSQNAEESSAKAQTDTEQETSHDMSSVGRDPLYENVRVLVMRMLQTQVSDTESVAVVRAGLEAVAAEMGLV